MKKSRIFWTGLLALCLPLAEACQAGPRPASVGRGADTARVAKVYMTTEISPASLLKVYHALGRKAEGRVAVKISTGEPGGHNFLDPNLIKGLVKEVNGTLVECNTACAGKRNTVEDNMQAARDHGFTAIAPVDIMDASPEDPKMGDIGILASLDPVALDKACTDLVRASDDHGKVHLIERIDSRHGMHTLDYGEQIGLGSQQYQLVRLDDK